MANYWRLLDATNNINNDFEKLRTKILIYRNNIIKTIQKNLWKNIEILLKTVILKRELIFILEDITLLILSIIVSIKNFTVEGLIEEIYKFIYKSLLKNKNYLKSDSTENPLLSYIPVLNGRKNKKKKLFLVFLLLIIPEEFTDSVLFLLSLYNINNNNPSTVNSL